MIKLPILLIYIFFIHWLGDFVFQTDEMSKKKSSSNRWLTRHIISYGNTFLAGSIPLLVYGTYLGINVGYSVLFYIIINMILHWITDYITSRMTKRLYEKGDIHNFFVVIGFDQFIHIVTLMVTLLISITFIK